jgi:hypothetical protein
VLSGRCSSKPSRRVLQPGVVHSPSFEIPRKIGNAANVVGDKKARSRFDEMDGIAVGSIFDRVVLILTQELESVIELEAVTEDLNDLKIVGANRKRNPRATLRIRRFSREEFDLRDTKITVCSFRSVSKRQQGRFDCVPTTPFWQQ